jgi:hypothetical protein
MITLEHLNNFKKCPLPLFRPRTEHTCHQKPYPFRETVFSNDAGKQRGTAGGVASKEEENLQASRSRGTVTKHPTELGF